jgi:hypothetical protein
MISLDLIKNELEDIKYYYSRKDMFDKAFNSVGKNEILQTVEKYNAIICSAPPKVYELYVTLYIECCTYEAAAEALCYSVNYVYKTHKKILDFFFNAMNKEAA